MLSIGDLARHTGVKVPTIRYYEQLGLLEAADRTEGNQRRYETTQRDQLAFIKHARDLGFTLEAIRELLDLSAHPESSCAGADDIAVRQLENVRDKIARLRKLEFELQRMVGSCCSGEVSECYVIRSLGDHHLCHSDHD